MEQLPCDAFKKNPDGSWSTIKPITIKSDMGEVKLSAGQTFRQGVLFMNLDLVALLNQHCN